MAFCASCGSAIDGKFCGSCGAAVNDAAPPPNPSQPQGYPQPGNGPANQGTQSGLADHEASALCYLPAAGFLISILFLVLAPYNTNRGVRFHAFQGLLLGLALFVFSIVISMFAIIPYIGALIWMAFWLASILGMIYLAWQTYQKERIVLPVIGSIAEQQARQG